MYYHLIKIVDFTFAVAFLVSSILFFITNAYLSLRLRKNKHELINKIASSAPEIFRNRIHLLMNAGMSWVFASSILYLWFGYLMLRYIWKISHQDLYHWHENIKELYGGYFFVYLFSALVANIFFTSIPIIFLDIYIR